MKLIKLTHYLVEDKMYINANCILSCEEACDANSRKYTKVGVLYQNEFYFFKIKETIEDIQYQLDGEDND